MNKMNWPEYSPEFLENDKTIKVFEDKTFYGVRDALEALESCEKELHEEGKSLFDNHKQILMIQRGKFFADYDDNQSYVVYVMSHPSDFIFKNYSPIRF